MKIYKDLMLNKNICLFFWELSLLLSNFILLLLLIILLIIETLIEFILINYVHVNNYFYLNNYMKKGGKLSKY